MKIKCAHCEKRSDKPQSAVGRARRDGAPLYCNRTCAGLGRRTHKTKAQKIEEKRQYDAQRRVLLADRLKAEKQAYHKRTYDPAKAAVERAKNMARHVEYCRQPAYKAKKHEYDKRRYAQKFGAFAECVGVLQELKAVIASRMSKYDIYMANGRYDKYAERRRERRLASAEDQFHRR